MEYFAEIMGIIKGEILISLICIFILNDLSLFPENITIQKKQQQYESKN